MPFKCSVALHLALPTTFLTDVSVRVLLVPCSADLALDAGSLCTSLVQSIDSA